MPKDVKYYLISNNIKNAETVIYLHFNRLICSFINTFYHNHVKDILDLDVARIEHEFDILS